jgi:Planctomycete cytochrome C
LTVAVILGSALALFAWVTQQSVKAITEVVPGVCPPEEQPNLDASYQPIQAEKGGSQPSLWTVAKTIFSKNCLSCHGPIRQLGNFRVDRREDYFKADAPLVVPGKSAESPLIEIVSGGRKDMKSAERHKLLEKDVTQLKAWIDAGASWPDSPDFEQ